MADDEGSRFDVSLGGEIDLTNAPESCEELCAAVDRASERLAVDLAAVTFVDSRAMGMMLHVHNYALARAKRVTWWNVQPNPAAAIEIIALDQVLDFAP
jgi:anti-anti-sigma factor